MPASGPTPHVHHTENSTLDEEGKHHELARQPTNHPRDYLECVDSPNREHGDDADHREVGQGGENEPNHCVILTGCRAEERL